MTTVSTPRPGTRQGAPEELFSESLLAQEVAKYSSLIQYSGRYDDVEYQYRHVELPKELAKYLPKDRTASVQEWANIGITMSPGWENYELIPHQRGNKHIMVFRRPRELGDRYPVRKVNGDGTTTVSTSASALKKKKTADPSQETPYQDGSSQNNTAQEGQLPSRPKVENDGKRG